MKIPTYELNREVMTLHYYGGYMSLSSKDADYVMTPRRLTPHWVSAPSVREQVGIKHQVYKQGGYWKDAINPLTGRSQRVFAFEPDGETQVREVPVFKTVRGARSQHFVEKPYGRALKVGDRVEPFNDLAKRFPKGTINAITDHYIKINDDYIPWSLGVTFKRV